MGITIHLKYTGQNDAALSFAREMIAGGTVEAIRAEPGNLGYEYFQSLDDPETVLLVDSWESQKALDDHHASPMMQTITALRQKYGLHMTAERFIRKDMPETDAQFLNS